MASCDAAQSGDDDATHQDLQLVRVLLAHYRVVHLTLYVILYCTGRAIDHRQENEPIPLFLRDRRLPVASTQAEAVLK
jgi:hypothetical protein